MTDGFRELFEQQFGRMVSLARMMGAPNPEDVAQEAFLKVYTHWKSIRTPSAAPAYLRRTVMNLVRNAALRDPARGSTRTLLGDPIAAASAESVVMGRDDVAMILTAISELPSRQREALVLRHWFGLPYEDVAASLRTSAAPARSLVHRALSRVLHKTHHDTPIQERK